MTIPEPFVLVDLSLSIDGFEYLKGMVEDETENGEDYDYYVFIPKVYEPEPNDQFTRVTYTLRIVYNVSGFKTLSTYETSLNPSPPRKSY